jgi:hypothetical protein
LPITTAFSHKELAVLDEKFMTTMERPMMNSYKRFSDRRGSDDIEHNVEASLWKRLGSESARDLPIKPLELSSERIRSFHREGNAIH